MKLKQLHTVPHLPVFVSPAYKRLIEAAPQADKKALRIQVEFSDKECHSGAAETDDPLGSSRHTIFPFLIHQYENRVLLLLTGRCLSYCRFCFRKNLMSKPQGYISKSDIACACQYIREHPSVREVLVSGGDPLSGSFNELRYALTELRAISPQLIIRLATRAPVFAPERFTPQVIELLRSLRPLWIIPHINHPAELVGESSECLTACIDAGISIQSQTVLLRGVNDSLHTLTELFNRLVCLGIKPGYLFQTDKAYGTAQFRVPFYEALELYNGLRMKLSGLSLPRFAVDLPDGGGKFPLELAAMLAEGGFTLEKDGFLALGYDKKTYRYFDA